MMPTLNQVTRLAMNSDLQGLACLAILFAVSCVPIWGLSLAIFRGYPGKAVTRWIHTRWPQLQRLPILDWEVTHSREFHIRMHLTPAFYVPRKIDHDEIASRHAELHSLIHQTRWPRRALYLLNCQLCQCFWIALTVLSIGLIAQSQPPTASRITDLFLSAISYAVIIAIASGWRPWKKKVSTSSHNLGGCNGGCGSTPKPAAG